MTEPPNQDVTRLLAEASRGDSIAAERLAALVFDELHEIAVRAMRRENDGHTLQPTELVDEAFVKMIGNQRASWENRSHFYAVAVQVIRRILIDHARRRRRVKRDHGIRVTLDESLRNEAPDSLDLLSLDDALTQLDALAPRQARVVELRFFGGFAIEETAEALGVSLATVKRDWTFARAFLLNALGPAT